MPVAIQQKLNDVLSSTRTASVEGCPSVTKGVRPVWGIGSLGQYITAASHWVPMNQKSRFFQSPFQRKGISSTCGQAQHTVLIVPSTVMIWPTWIGSRFSTGNMYVFRHIDDDVQMHKLQLGGENTRKSANPSSGKFAFAVLFIACV